MAFIPCPLGLEITYKYLVEGQAVCNVTHHAQTILRDEAGISALADTALGLFGASVALHNSILVSSIGVKVRQLNEADGIQVEQDFITPVDGTAETGANAPTNVALVLTVRTARIGRSYRGRMYLPGVLTSGSGVNFADVTWANALAAAWVGHFTALDASEGLTHCVMSKSNGKVARSVAVLTPVTSVSLRDLRVDTQRRRLP